MISLFKRTFDKQSAQNLSIQEYLDNIKYGRWQDDVLNVRAGKLKKDKVPAVTISGVFKERKAKDIIEHSGFICIDVDAKDQICHIDIDAIKEDPYVYAVHKSVGGFGYAVLVKIDPERHLDAFLGLEQYFFVNYSIVVDKSCKDTSRLRYVSYDPDIYVNEKAKVFKKYLPKKEVRKQQVKTIVVKSDFDDMVNQASGMNLFDDYQSYITLAFALTSEFGEAGRHYFHALSSSSSKYDRAKADQHYDKALSRNGTGITIASVYHIFKQAGISLTSKRTEQIKTIVKLADDPKKVLEEMGLNDDENLIQKLEKPAEKTELDEVIELIKISKIKFNEITRNFEIDGVNMDDRMLANFYTKVWQKIDDSISKDKIWTLIMSRENTPSYNPIQDWFEANKNVKYSNEFQKLIDCFKINVQYAKDDGIVVDMEHYLDVYLKKWLLGIIGSAHGTYSLMILVLIGEQGTNKTEFFRNLLPDELEKYYAESNLDEGKDSEILMCKKLLIIDDEFGGKSKKDATKLKRLSSQQTFSIRAPYGRISEDLNRLAVLGGTSNDPEVINDPTGNRRIIPVNLVSFDIEKYKQIDKTKLFIELYHEWLADPKGWFLEKDEIDWLNTLSVKNTEVCIEDEILSSATVHPFAELTSTDIKVAIEMKYPSIKTNTKRIGMALKKLGFEQKLVRRGKLVKKIYQISLNLE